jgi:hypothetical protein
MDEIRVFISYSQSDTEIVESIFNKIQRKPPFLIGSREYKYTFWWDKYIMVGDRWERDIIHNITECDVALCFVSENFVLSNYINKKELPLAIERYDEEGVPIIGFLLSNCNFQNSEIKRFQLMPKEYQEFKPYDKWKDKEEVLEMLMLKLKKAAYKSLERLPIPLRNARLSLNKKERIHHNKENYSQQDANIMSHFYALEETADKRNELQESNIDLNDLASELKKEANINFQYFSVFIFLITIILIGFLLFK